MKKRIVVALVVTLVAVGERPLLVLPLRAQSSTNVEEKDRCLKKLNLIYEAIQGYRRDHKELPNWLSDLIPNYIADASLLACPVTERTGVTRLFGVSDPKVATSYIFEFCAQIVPGEVAVGGGKLTMREYKSLQMALVGGETPILRCHLHRPVLNVGFDGKTYESSTDWEERFADVIQLEQLTTPSRVVVRVVDRAKLDLTEDERVRVMLTELMALSINAEGEKARELAQQIINAKLAPESAKETARGIIKKIDAIGKPLELQFTALDGREVTMAKLRGKVVLVDFWATWCGPCIVELPNIKAAYKKLHPKGFEIVGISFDTSKDTLEKFVTREGMPWPQYFDGRGWQNKFGQEFGIRSIPTMWLIDKNGLLRDINAREGLVAKVEKLLAGSK